VKEKEVVMNYNYVVNSTLCLSCADASFSVISPNPAVKGEHAEINFILSEKMELPAIGWIEDQRGNRVQGIDLTERNTLVSIGKLQPAKYVMVAVSGAEKEEVHFSIVNSVDDKLTISPNPAFKEVDREVQMSLVTKFKDVNTEEQMQMYPAEIRTQIEAEKNGVYEVEVSDMNGQVVKRFNAEGQNFTMDIGDMSIGSYVVTVQGENSFFQENLELTMKGKPYMRISPNPAVLQSVAEVVNPLVSYAKWELVIKDKMGHEVRRWQTDQNPISFDVSDLMPDLYYLQMGNGQEFYTQTFRKN
jgi:hypothetical protein